MPLSNMFKPAGIAIFLGTLAPGLAMATPSLVVDVDSGSVLSQDQATQTWYPASITKLMTVYVALKAVEAGRLTLETPLTVSGRAAHQAPSRMGFHAGTEVTLDNSLKMLMVKSANDIAVTIAENIGGSVEGFASEMNRYSANLGMRESHWVNPNGLPESRQVTSARDMAILARALLREFPSQRELFGIGALQLGDRIIPTHNGLLGRYPGADGMKTGFTCAAGFNVVASASRGGKRLIAVVLGAPTARDRTAKAANLFDKGFAAWSGGGSLEALPVSGTGEAPNMRGSACMRRGGGGWASEFEDFDIPLSNVSQELQKNPALEYIYQQAGTLKPTAAGGRAVAARSRPQFTPVAVYVGRAPGWSGPPARVASPKPEVIEAAPANAVAASPGAEVSTDTTAYAPLPVPRPDGAPMALSGAIASGKSKLLARGKGDRDVKAGKLDKAGAKVATADPVLHKARTAKKPKPPTAPE